MSGSQRESHLLTRGRLLAVVFRSFTIQASWNYERMIGLGFLFSMFPGLVKQSERKDALVSSALRHLEFFNSQPYLASYALGTSLRLEEDALEGTLDEESLRKWKKLLPTPLGSVGDTLFWKSWRPLCGVLGVLLTFLTGWIGPVTYIIMYNVLHLYVRVRGVFSGYRRGRGALDDLKGVLYRRFPAWCEELTCILAGALVVICSVRGAHTFPLSGSGALFLLSTAAFWLLLKFFTPRFLFYTTSVVMILGLVLWEMFIGN
jgi:mannose/fructose/N-acetylgalactosamine-specific phosphotransferase system component IID